MNPRPRNLPPLPHPHVLLFDGTCHLCHSTVAFVLPRDRPGRFRYLPIQSGLGREIYRAAGLDPDRPDSLLLVTEGQCLVRSDAVIELARHLGWPWRLASILGVLPTPLRDAAYRLVAQNRHRWFGHSSSCIVPTPETRARLIEEIPPPGPSAPAPGQRPAPSTPGLSPH